MKARIPRAYIHHYLDQAVVDENGNPTGEVQDILQLDIIFPEYPNLPTYGISVGLKGISTKSQLRSSLRSEIQLLASQVEAQMERDQAVQDDFQSWGWLVEFETDDL